MPETELETRFSNSRQSPFFLGCHTASKICMDSYHQLPPLKIQPQKFPSFHALPCPPSPKLDTHISSCCASSPEWTRAAQWVPFWPQHPFQLTSSLSACASISVNGHRFCLHSKTLNNTWLIPYPHLSHSVIYWTWRFSRMWTFSFIHTPTAQIQALMTSPFNYYYSVLFVSIFSLFIPS